MSCRCWGVNWIVFITPPRHPHGSDHQDVPTLSPSVIVGSSGPARLYLLSYRGDFTTAETVRVVANRARNIDGRLSDGLGGFLNFNKRTRRSDGKDESGFKFVQFLQLDKVQQVPGMEVAWNEVVNEPGRSRVEDNINIYRSSGTADSPLLIHDNYIQGAYTIRPWQANSSDETWEYSWGYSGGGILLGDGSSSTPGGAAAFVRAYDNQVISTTNYGIAIAAGHDIEFSNNRILSSGILPHGRAITAQNVGAYIWDCYGDRNRGTFFSNSGSGNLIGWAKGGRRNDWWLPHAASWTGNIHWFGPITPVTEMEEFAYWKVKLEAAGMSVGP